MSLHGYRVALELHAHDKPFYALIMAAMLKADTQNTAKLRHAFPDTWEELQERYNSPGGLTAAEGGERDDLPART
jgi:hypothetical protein